MKYLLYLLGFAVFTLIVLWTVWQLLVGVLFPLIAFVVGGVIQLVLGAVILLAVLWGDLKFLVICVPWASFLKIRCWG